MQDAAIAISEKTIALGIHQQLIKITDSPDDCLGKTR
jgi:hypothetical protein